LEQLDLLVKHFREEVREYDKKEDKQIINTHKKEHMRLKFKRDIVDKVHCETDRIITKNVEEVILRKFNFAKIADQFRAHLEVNKAAVFEGGEKEKYMQKAEDSEDGDVPGKDEPDGNEASNESGPR